MPTPAWLKNLGRRISNDLVGVTSGSTPIGALDTPRAYRSIVIIGLLALGASGWLIYRGIVATTARPQPTANANAVAVAAVAELEKLKQKDTDGDGISDYDELYKTRTSPYLKDSDGDGASDQAEIDKGTDPNCPQGKVCEGFRLLTSPVDAQGQLTPEFLRRALASAGVSQSTLDQTDDASLLGIYRQVVKSQPATNTNATANTNGSAENANTAVPSIANTNASTPPALSQLQQLTPAEIRQLLVQNGLDQATLNAVDDATLQQIFQEAIKTSQ